MAGRFRAVTSRRVELAVYLLLLLVIGLYTRGAVNGVDHRARVEAARARTEAINTKVALCTFRADLEQRVDSSQRYLDEHPEGVVSLGITAAQIRLTIRNQRLTLESLATLNCPRNKETP